MNQAPKDRLPFLLLPGILLALSGVTLLAPRRPALAAPLPRQAAPPSAAKPAAGAFDDGDGDELLEHWGDPKYSGEERIQLAGMTGGFLLLGTLACRKRLRRKAQPVALSPQDIMELRKAA